MQFLTVEKGGQSITGEKNSAASMLVSAVNQEDHHNLCNILKDKEKMWKNTNLSSNHKIIIIDFLITH